MIAIPEHRKNDHESDGSPPDPTPTEIRNRAAAIRAHWSQQTRKRRSVQPETVHWMPPGVRMDDVSENIAQADQS